MMSVSNTMIFENIPRHLRDVEEEYHVRILLAVESGSRAWGFASADSDWDVRFIYVNEPAWYFQIEEGRDVIEHMYEDNVDLVGWDLKKALKLYRRTNPSMMEWLHSPIIYRQDYEFMKCMQMLEPYYFNPIRAMYHYHSIYIKHDERYLQKQGYPMKRFLYYLRGVLACKWIAERKDLPPVQFRELVQEMVDDETIRLAISDVLKKKRESKEHDMTEVCSELVEYAKNLADFYSQTIGNFRPEIDKRKDNKALDELMFRMVNL